MALRYFNVYGPRMDAFGVYTEVMIRWMECLAKGQPCLILGEGTQTMDFVFVDDVARANLAAAKSCITDDAINGASGTETSLNELAATLGRVMGVTLAPEYGPARKINTVSTLRSDTRRDGNSKWNCQRRLALALDWIARALLTRTKSTRERMDTWI